VDKEWPESAQLAMKQMWAEIKRYKKASRKAMVERDEAMALHNQALKEKEDMEKELAKKSKTTNEMTIYRKTTKVQKFKRR